MVGATLPKLAECRSCHDPIRFVRMAATGRNMPVNPRPTDQPTGHGTVAARLAGPMLIGYVVSAERPQDDAHPYRFTPHWSTCEKPTKKAAPTPAPDEALF